jgi:hypothetical protein
MNLLALRGMVGGEGAAATKASNKKMAGLSLTGFDQV